MPDLVFLGRQIMVHESHKQDVNPEEAQQALRVWIQSKQTTLLNKFTQSAFYLQLLAHA